MKKNSSERNGNGGAASATKEDHRGRVKSDFPKHTLEDALRVAKALSDKNGGQPLPPTETAIAIGLSPGSSDFRTLLSASIKYSLTSGSFNSEKVTLEEGGRNIVEPRTPDDERKALVQAALSPPTFRAVYEYFRGKKLPEDIFLQNTLVREFSVPREHAEKCAAVFTKNMERVGLIRNASTGKWLSTSADDLATSPGVEHSMVPPVASADGAADDIREPQAVEPPSAATRPVAQQGPDPRLNRVFVTHGKNTAFITPIKDLLNFGQLIPVVSVERESVAQPVPDKVMNDMRTCGAAIIHIEDEMKLVDAAAKEHIVLNSNVLIEIGAAMALYGRRIIFLVKDGVQLPSNLQGLYEARYSGDKLDGDVTIRLLKAINEMKTHQLPNPLGGGS
ncbi:MAG: nucleotide-binding protein [Chthoniobacterales bacterium]|nr:nucleotide-binding protein [Chthoniobacterales bacterium]